MMYDISERIDLLKLYWEIIFLCLFFLVTAVSVSVFIPARSKDTASAEVQQLAKEFLFPEEWNAESDMYAVLPGFSVDSSVMDKGLELYREPTSRAAVEWFYLHITGKRDVTYAILDEANKNDVPLSLAFALAYTESHYKADAINRNTNTSIDRGLFQLNNFSFPMLTESDFFNPETSARYGMRHLRFCLDTAGNEVTALAMYNAGTARVRKNTTPHSTLLYVDSIMRYKNRLDAAFSDEIATQYTVNHDSDSRLALAK